MDVDERLRQLQEEEQRTAAGLAAVLLRAKREKVTLDPKLLRIAHALIDCAKISAGRAFYGFDDRGRMRLWYRDKPKPRITRCGATTRRGAACKQRPVDGKNRCRLHGGLSRGPTTPEGRQAIADSNRRRAVARRQNAQKAELSRTFAPFGEANGRKNQAEPRETA